VQEPQASAVADEKRDAETVFKRTNRALNRGNRKVEGVGCAA